MAEKLTHALRVLLEAASEPHTVVWPSNRVAGVFRKVGDDGRIHIIAPSDEAVAAFDAGYLSGHGELTPAGIRALEESNG